MTTITQGQIDKAVELLRDVEPRHTVTRSQAYAAIVHAFGASALGVSDEFAECLLHHIGMSTDSWLSEKAIALIMWERTMAISARHEEKALSAVKYYNSVLKSFDFDSESPPVVHAFTWRARAAREAIEWAEWAHMCRQYLKARGWEPLP